jgi:hypothetical protein
LQIARVPVLQDHRSCKGFNFTKNLQLLMNLFHQVIQLQGMNFTRGVHYNSTISPCVTAPVSVFHNSLLSVV